MYARTSVASTDAAVYRRKLKMKAKFESGSSQFSVPALNQARPAWGQSGVNQRSTQGQYGVNSGSIRGQSGVNPGSARAQSEVNLGSSCSALPQS